MNLNTETSGPQEAFTLVARDRSEGRGVNGRERQGPNTVSKKKRGGGNGGHSTGLTKTQIFKLCSGFSTLISIRIIWRD